MCAIFAIMIFIFLPGVVPSQDMAADKAKGAGGISCDSSIIKSWAVKCRIVRGYMNIADKSLGLASTGDESSCTGKADNITASLGDSGVAVVSFSEPLSDLPGNDFVVFENSFDGIFLELAFVEVSTDSIRWVRFPSVSGTQTNSQIGTFDNLDPLKISNLAGKYKALYGTPFDLNDIKDSTGINLSNIKYVKIIDVIGAISGKHISCDSKGNKINDPWPTPFPQSGFDLDGVAILKSVSSITDNGVGINTRIFPNPAKNILNIQFDNPENRIIRIFDLHGKSVMTVSGNDIITKIDISRLFSGIYLINVVENSKTLVTRIIKE
jgi:hypothetical protein